MKIKNERAIEYLKYLGLEYDIDDYESRFLIQKTIFILKNMGLPLSYEFSFGKAGTYSKELSHDYYNNKEKLTSKDTQFILNDSEREILDKYRNVMDYDKSLLEAVSTILYFELQYESLNNVIAKFKKVKPHISEREIMVAQNKSKSLKFKDEFLTSELMEEITLWESMDNSSVR